MPTYEVICRYRGNGEIAFRLPDVSYADALDYENAGLGALYVDIEVRPMSPIDPDDTFAQ